MADGTIGRANIEIGANTAPLDADLSGAKAKVEQAAKGAESAAQNQASAKAQAAKVETTTAQKTQERLAAEIKITQEIVKQGAAKARARSAEDQAKKEAAKTDAESGTSSSSGWIMGIASSVSSAVGTVTALWHGLKGAASAARELAKEMQAISDAFSGNKFNAMGDFTRQMEELKRTAEEQRQAITDWQNSLEGIVDWYYSGANGISNGAKIRNEKLLNEFNASLKRAREQYQFEEKRKMQEFLLDLRKFREELNASAGIGNQPIELFAVADAIRTLALRSEASR